MRNNNILKNALESRNDGQNCFLPERRPPVCAAAAAVAAAEGAAGSAAMPAG